MSRLGRRSFLAAAGAFLAAPLAVGQKAGKVYQVGFLAPTSLSSDARELEEFRKALRGFGYIEGQNLTIESRWANGNRSELPRLAAELAQLGPDVIVCIGPSAALALKGIGAQIPAVFVIVSNPVELGLAQSLPRPGGMFTGFATIAPESLVAKQIELLRETAPKATRIAFLTNPDNPVHRSQRRLRLEVAKGQGLQAIEVQARTREELETAFAEAGRLKAEIMHLSGDPLPLAHRDLVTRLALRQRLPVMFLFFEHVEAGGLISYGIDRTDHVRRSAAYVDKLLKGAAPRDLPIEEPTKYTLAINLKTAKALGIKFPQSVLLRADKVFQ